MVGAGNEYGGDSVASLANLKLLSVVCLRRFYSDFNPKCTVYKCSNFSGDIHHSSRL